MYQRKDQSAAWQRFEAKYLVDEHAAARLRRKCRAFLPLDKYCAHRPGSAYPITSIYLDSPDARLYRSTIEREPHRYKLRIRTYVDPESEQPPSSSFFEVKHRVEGIVRKTRARIGPELARVLQWDARTVPSEPAGHDPMTIENLARFQTFRSQLGAQPVVGVRYYREVYEAPERGSVRISFDRHLQYGILDADGKSPHIMWAPAPLNHVILEIKFTNTYPFWVRDLIRQEGLMRRGFCKFVHCMRTAGLVSAAPIAGVAMS